MTESFRSGLGSLAVLDHVFIAPPDRDDILALIAGMNAVIEAISPALFGFLVAFLRNIGREVRRTPRPARAPRLRQSNPCCG